MHGVLRPTVIAPRRRVWGRVFAIALVMSLVTSMIAGRAPARAETKVAALTKLLASPSDKTRLSAVLALAKLGDPAALRPLVTALRDPSDRVRAVAATALGRLEHIAALPTLRTLAAEDTAPEVRKAASTAVIKIAKHQKDEREHPDADELKPPHAPAPDTAARRTAPTGHGPSHDALDEAHPDLYLLINSSADESPGNTDKKTRELHAQIIKRVLLDRLRAEASVTSALDDARRWNLEARHIDLSVTRLETRVTGGVLEIDAQLRLAISDDSGKMLSFLSGGAKVAGRNAKLSAPYMPALRREALENAMRGMFGKLLAHLHEPPT
jgi:hypothetical protein